MNETDQHIDPNDRFDLFSYERYFNDGACIIREGEDLMYLSETPDAYLKQVYPPDPATVATLTSYFPDTLTLKSRGQFIKEWDIPIGIWKEYDRYGMEVESINQDEHYPVSWEEMQKRFLANGIHVDDIRQLRRIQNPNTQRYLWVLTLKSPHGIIDIAQFDGETGDLIERKQTQIKVS